MKTSLILALAAAASATRAPPGCAVDSCFWKQKIPAEWKPIAIKFCKLVVPGVRIPVAPRVSASTITITTQAAPTTVFETVAVPVTQVDGTVCSDSTSADATTQINYPRFTPVRRLKDRAAEYEEDEEDDGDSDDVHAIVKRAAWPGFTMSGCKRAPTVEKLKAACKCFLESCAPESQGPVPVVTAVQTVPAPAVTITTVNQITETVVSCTSTSTSTSYGPVSSCGAPAGEYASPTTGQITCVQPANAPSGSVNAFHRIEADNNQGTVFEDCIYAGPRSITTPSGGTHQCGASTGTSITSQTDAGAMRDGYTYDGTFSPSFNDYFITRIGNTQQSGNSYWGVLNNGVFTTSGGCGAQVRAGDSSLWQWDAFNLQVLLTITPQYQVAAVGSTNTITVTARSPNGGGSSPFPGATVAGLTGVSDANGQLSFTAPSVPGCYQYKATGASAGRSNAYYLNVVSAFPATIG